MTDLLPGTETRRYSLPASSRSKRFNRAAVGCLLLMIPLTLLMIEMHPRVPTMVSAFLVGLPVLSVVLAVLGRKKEPAPKAATSSMRRGVITVAVVVSLIVLLVAILAPEMCQGREQANRMKCMSNLRQIGLALQMYTEANEGMSPASLDVLITDAAIKLSPEVFVCPSGTDERATGSTDEQVVRNFREQPNHLSYVYLGTGMSDKMPPDRILIYERPDEHKTAAGSHFLYGDGHVEFQGKKWAEKIVAQINAGHNPPLYEELAKE